jgi:hypothetical protein
MEKQKNPKQDREFDERERRRQEQRENNPGRREHETTRPGTKPGTLGSMRGSNWEAGGQGMQKSLSGEKTDLGGGAERTNVDESFAEELYDTSGEHRGGGMGGRVTGTRYDGGMEGSMYSQDMDEEDTKYREEDEEHSRGIANRSSETRKTGRYADDEDKLVHEKQ